MQFAVDTPSAVIKESAVLNRQFQCNSIGIGSTVFGEHFVAILSCVFGDNPKWYFRLSKYSERFNLVVGISR